MDRCVENSPNTILFELAQHCNFFNQVPVKIPVHEELCLAPSFPVRVIIDKSHTASGIWVQNKKEQNHEDSRQVRTGQVFAIFDLELLNGRYCNNLLPEMLAHSGRSSLPSR